MAPIYLDGKGQASLIRSIDRPYLYRVMARNLQRVPCEVSSLSPQASYLLVKDAVRDQERRVFAWHGRKAVRLDKILADRIADAVLCQDLSSTLGKVVRFVQGGGETYDRTLHGEFWHCLGEKYDEANPCSIAENENAPILTLPTILRAVDWEETGGWIWRRGGQYSLREVCKSEGAKMGYQEGTWDEDAALLLACPEGEFYLWIGEACAELKRAAAQKLAGEMLASYGPLGSLKHLMANMEPVLFLERFRGWERNKVAGIVPVSPHRGATFAISPLADTTLGGFGLTQNPTSSVSPHHASVHSLHQKRRTGSRWKMPGLEGPPTAVSLWMSVERMSSPHMGTLGMKGRDNSDAANRLITCDLFTMDEESTLRVWRVGHDTGSFMEVPRASPAFGIFTSCDAFIVVFSCKNGSRHIVYMWQGSRAPVSVKAAAALQLKDHVKELNLVNGASGVTGAVEVIRVEQGKESPFLLQLFNAKGSPFLLVDGSSASGWSGASIAPFILGVKANSVFGDAVAASQLQGKPGGLPSRAGCVMIPPLTSSSRVEVLLWLGDECPVSVRSLVEGFATSGGCADRLLFALYGAKTSPSSIVPHFTWVTGLEKQPVEFWDAFPHEIIPSPASPVRLFCVSATKKSMGVPWVEEVGPGESFTQSDMDEDLAYILDSAMVLVWHGSAASETTSKLASLVALRFQQSLTRHFPDNPRKQIENIASGYETPMFTWSFRQWNASHFARHPKVIGTSSVWLSFEPDKITDADCGCQGEPNEETSHTWKREQLGGPSWPSPAAAVEASAPLTPSSPGLWDTLCAAMDSWLTVAEGPQEAELAAKAESVNEQAVKLSPMSQSPLQSPLPSPSAAADDRKCPGQLVDYEVDASEVFLREARERRGHMRRRTVQASVQAISSPPSSPSQKSPQHQSPHSPKAPQQGLPPLHLKESHRIEELEHWVERTVATSGPIIFPESLRDGIVLCQLMNALHGEELISRISSSAVPFRQQENLAEFRKAALGYGLRDATLFKPVDLFFGSNLELVLEGLLALKELFEARSEGMQMEAEGEQSMHVERAYLQELEVSKVKNLEATEMEAAERLSVELEAAYRQVLREIHLMAGEDRNVAEVDGAGDNYSEDCEAETSCTDIGSGNGAIDETSHRDILTLLVNKTRALHLLCPGCPLGGELMLWRHEVVEGRACVWLCCSTTCGAAEMRCVMFFSSGDDTAEDDLASSSCTAPPSPLQYGSQEEAENPAQDGEGAYYYLAQEEGDEEVGVEEEDTDSDGDDDGAAEDDHGSLDSGGSDEDEGNDIDRTTQGSSSSRGSSVSPNQGGTWGWEAALPNRRSSARIATFRNPLYGGGGPISPRRPSGVASAANGSASSASDDDDEEEEVDEEEVVARYARGINPLYLDDAERLHALQDLPDSAVDLHTELVVRLCDLAVAAMDRGATCGICRDAAASLRSALITESSQVVGGGRAGAIRFACSHTRLHWTELHIALEE
jgi:hypothetical protein